MTGKRRNTPLAPEEDRELTRQAARAMHEAVQEAKDTLRALQAATGEAEGWLDMSWDHLDEQFAKFVNDRMDEAAAHIAKSDARLQESVDRVTGELAGLRKTIADEEARAAGFADRAGLLTQLTNSILEAMMAPAYVQTIADVMMRAHGCQCPPGAHSAVAKPHSDSGRVTVRVARPGEAPGIYLGER